MIAFPVKIAEGDEPGRRVAASLRRGGLIRLIAGDRTVELAEEKAVSGSWAEPQAALPWYVVVDRLTAGHGHRPTSGSAIRWKSLSPRGKDGAACWWKRKRDADVSAKPQAAFPFSLDGRPWRRAGFSTQLACPDCDLEYPTPEPRLYSFNSPMGACPQCEGFGNVIDVDMDLIVPDPAKTIAEGAIAPWNSPAYRHELDELLALAPDYGLPVDVPFSRLEPRHLALIQRGRAAAGIRRAARVLRLAGAAEVQDARPRVSEPVAELSHLPGLRRLAAPARGPGHADRRQEHRRSLGNEALRRGRVLPPTDAARASGPRPILGRPPPHDPRTGPGPAGIPGGRRAGLSHAGPHAADAQRRRGPPRRADRRAGFEPGPHALCARRALDRPASPRRSIA